MRVRYLGCTDDQVTYGGHDDPRRVLIVGEVYRVKSRTLRDWSTSVRLVGIQGQFNSVCFEDVAERETQEPLDVAMQRLAEVLVAVIRDVLRVAGQEAANRAHNQDVDRVRAMLRRSIDA